jgi:putative Ca2+/H+ antiporter (TMEM165/GDT1 family)
MDRAVRNNTYESVLEANMRVLVLAYVTILVVELIGDKSLYTIASLSLRFKALSILGGATLAVMLKMLAAVLLGGMISRIPPGWTEMLSGAGFAASAVLVILRNPNDGPQRLAANITTGRAASISFGSLFFTEWADAGQLSAAALAAKTGAAAAVWFGGTLALVSKCLLALAVGRRLRSIIPDRALQLTASGVLSALAALSLAKALERFLNT